MSTRILTLDTLAARPTISIDGVDYAMQTADDFGLADIARMQRMQNDLNGVLNRDDLTDSEIARLAGLLAELTALVLPGLPAEVDARLKDGQRLAIIRAFREATAGPTPLPPSLPNPPIGAL